MKVILIIYFIFYVLFYFLIDYVVLNDLVLYEFYSDKFSESRVYELLDFRKEWLWITYPIKLLIQLIALQIPVMLINEDRSMKDISKKSWRGPVGYAPQEIKIFNGSLGYNLSLDPNPACFEQVVRRCQELGLHEFFDRMPQGYFTQVGEEGVNLSGGQRQLVGIARALIKRPKVLLLDEFTGAMDRMTEQKMLDLILKVKKEIPVLVVTHRIQPALLADEVLILEKGMLKDRGSPMELRNRENLLSASLRDLGMDCSSGLKDW
ncbi:ATP-binding cassette domain-containing protein [Algoriphagus algorifonticola]|uniref:ATP-binding cassette domain-containing protein n=1 Tax=Algoriphagus algorifonticola TaxID=2593007 RepID=UPI0011A8B127|nr:ATP-binding cassette domain-containing protein [Algoriphagus algorifonticola]